MKISPITYYSKNLNSPSFKQYDRYVEDEDGNRIYSNYTVFFRDDLEWGDFVSFLDERFKNVSKVDIYDIGCSDGSEPYSLSILLSQTKNPEKFFPIHASDFDEVAINRAKKGVYEINSIEGTSFYDYTGREITDFIEYKSYGNWHLKPEVMKNTEFKVEDVLDTLDKIDSKNSVILCRNFLPYLSAEKRQKATQKLIDLAKNNNVIVIGLFDKNRTNIENEFYQRNLRPVNYSPNISYYSENVYTKKDKSL